MHSVLNVKPGDRFGRLIVIQSSQSGYSKNPSYSICKCDCGNQIEILTVRLWKMRSCGCMRNKPKFHKTHPKEWRAWQGMKARCFRKTNKKYHLWGGRGITVCDGIRYNVGYFIELVGNAPSNKHSIDRIDNNGNYSCGKCSHCIKNGWGINIRWATNEQQSQNRSIKKYNYNGVDMCLSEICRVANMPFKTVHARISCGWNFNDAIKTPVRKINFKNKTK